MRAAPALDGPCWAMISGGTPSEVIAAVISSEGAEHLLAAAIRLLKSRDAVPAAEGTAKGIPIHKLHQILMRSDR